MTKKHNIILQPSGSRGQVDEGMSIRSAARELGVEIESICAENATCGKCMVLIEEGRFEKYNIDSKRENLSLYHRGSRLLCPPTKYFKEKAGKWGMFGYPANAKCMGMCWSMFLKRAAEINKSSARAPAIVRSK
jgi:ferredoxin